MSYLRTFLPWIVYAVVPSDYWQWAAAAALCVSMTEILRKRRGGWSWDSMIIEVGSAIFFAALALTAFIDPTSPLHPYTPAVSSGVLAVIAGLSLATGRPFTLGIAKRQTPREFWDHPGFVRVNRVITSVWTASFVAGCIALALLAHAATATRTTTQIAAFVVPTVFTVAYVKRTRTKVTAITAANNGRPGHAEPW